MRPYTTEERLELYKRVVRIPHFFNVQPYFIEATLENPFRKYFFSVTPNFDILLMLEVEALRNPYVELDQWIADLKVYKEIYRPDRRIFY